MFFSHKLEKKTRKFSTYIFVFEPEDDANRFPMDVSFLDLLDLDSDDDEDIGLEKTS